MHEGDLGNHHNPTELHQSVEMHLPTSMTQAATLAILHEHLNSSPKLHKKKYTSSKPKIKSAFSSNELWKARQLNEYRRLNNLCFKCGENILQLTLVLLLLAL
jgi:hypothetical protein